MSRRNLSKIGTTAVLLAFVLLGAGCSDDGITIPSVPVTDPDAGGPGEDPVGEAAVAAPSSPSTSPADPGIVDLDATLPSRVSYPSRIYRAFDQAEVESRLGAVIRPGQMVTTSTGSRITMSEALAEVNQWEATLNGKGLSLRDGPSVVRRTAVAVDVDRLSRQTAEIASSYQQIGDHGSPLDELMASPELAAYEPSAQAFQAQQRELAERLGFRTQDYHLPTQNWEKEFGNPNIASAWMRASYGMSGGAEEFSASATAAAGATAFSREIKIVDARASCVWDGTGDPDMDLYLMVAGRSVSLPSIDFEPPSYSSDPDCGFGSLPEDEFQVDYEATVSYPVLGFIKVVATVGASGTAGYGLFASYSSLGASMGFVATADVSLYGEVGAAVDLGITICGKSLSLAKLSGGIGASLTLIEDRLEAGGIVSLVLEGSFENWRLEYDYDCTNDLTLLAGDVYVWAKADFPWPFNFADRRWEDVLFSWDGYTIHGTLFDGGDSIPLYVR